MSTIQEIEQAILKLSPGDFAALRDWLAEVDAGAWDRQIAADAAGGKLDRLLDEARRDRDAGRCTEI